MKISESLLRKESSVSENTLNRKSLRLLIIETLAEGDIVDLAKYKQSKQQDTEQEWFDLFDEEELQKYKTSGRLSQQTRQNPEQEADDDETFEEYLQGIESGKVVDMFQDDDPLQEDKMPTGMYGDPAGLLVPYGDEIDEYSDLDEDDSDAERNRTLDLQLKLRNDTANVNKPGSTALQRQAVRGDQAAIASADDGVNF